LQKLVPGDLTDGPNEEARAENELNHKETTARTQSTPTVSKVIWGKKPCEKGEEELSQKNSLRGPVYGQKGESNAVREHSVSRREVGLGKGGKLSVRGVG